MKKVKITNYAKDGSTKYPHGLEAELLLVRKNSLIGCSNALAYVADAHGFDTKGLIVTLFKASEEPDQELSEPWILSEDGFSFSDETSDEAIKQWIDLLAFMA